MVSALNAYTQGALTQTNHSGVTNAGKEQTNSQNHNSDEGNVITDTVEISAEAQEISQAQAVRNAALDARISYYQQFLPTYEGFSSYNLAQSIVDPGAQPFSQNRSFEEVAQAARENLDKNYKRLEDIGKPYDPDRGSVTVESLYGEFDRRALYAVASNKDGLFTEEEQGRARDLMRRQQGMAMGLYQGPSELKGKFTTSLVMNHEQVFKSGVQFMDQVSLEERATDIEWAHQRAAMQHAYEKHAEANGSILENFNINHPLVNLILEGLETWKYKPGLTSDGDISSADELRNEPWFEAYANRLDEAIAQTRELYGLGETQA